MATLLYCVQLGTIEMNPWNARLPSLDHPDYLVLDLDPGPQTPFDRIVEAALWIKETLDRYGLSAAVKTSGARGIHIFVPLSSDTRERDAMRAAERIAVTVVTAHQRETTVHRSVRGRGVSKVYLDYGQNARGKTVAAAYSVRPRPGATVSTPLAWQELTPALDPHDFTIHTIPARIEASGDLWAPIMRNRNPGEAVTKM